MKENKKFQQLVKTLVELSSIDNEPYVQLPNKKDFEDFVGSRSGLIESRRANAYAGMPEGYLTINQFSKKYDISPTKLMLKVTEKILEHRVSCRGWKLLPEDKTCEELGVGKYANRTHQGENIQKDKTSG